MAIARLLIRMASWLAPSGARADFLREWLAELAARPSRSRGPRPIVFALGAPLHAIWLRKENWRPALLLGDLRFGLRGLKRRPGFAAAAILTLALGTGATTAIFSIVYGVLLKPLPYREPDRLVQLWETNPLRNWTDAEVAPGNLISWRERNRVFTGIAFYAGAMRDGALRSLTLGGDEPARVRALPVSANFFAVLGVGARLGRTFVAGEDEDGRQRVIVLGDAFWRARFAADPGVVGRTLVLSDRPYTVVGVMPASFKFGSSATDFWVPLAMDWSQARQLRVPHFFRAIARLGPGVSVSQAQENLSRIATDLEREFPESNTQMGAGVGPLDDWFVGQSRRPLWLFLAAVGLVLLIASANVANLLLSRTSERAHEMSLRAALGASRSRLVRQLLVESCLLAATGTVLGAALAYGGVRAFLSMAPAGLPRLDEVSVDPMVGAFAVGLTGLTTLLVGLVPALQGAGRDLKRGMDDGARVTGGGQRVRRLLVLGEVALAVVLLVGAALTLRSFRALAILDPGVPIAGAVTAKVALPSARYGDDGKSAAFFEEALARVRALPGVVGAGATTRLPLEGPGWTGDLYIEGRPEVHGRELRHKSITTGYLEALGVHFIAGRAITVADAAGAPLAVVANQTLARKYFPNGDAVGRRIAYDAPAPKVRWRTIVGVVSDEAQDGLGAPIEPEVYESNAQQEFSDLAMLVRSAQSPDRIASDVRRVIHELDPQIALYEVGPLPDVVARSLAKTRVAAWLVGIFGVAALMLASIGVYGVAAYSVSLRTREIGVRVAFGAARSDIVGLILRQELGVIVAGLVIGAGLAAASGRAVSSVLAGADGLDPISYAAGVAILFLAGLAACLIPARRALRIDPATSLRSS